MRNRCSYEATTATGEKVTLTLRQRKAAGRIVWDVITEGTIVRMYGPIAFSYSITGDFVPVPATPLNASPGTAIRRHLERTGRAMQSAVAL